MPAPAPTFGYAWQDGFVAPFLPADLTMAGAALDHALLEVARRCSRAADPVLSFADLGCGDGAVVLLAAKRGMRAYGIDLDDALLACAREAAAAAAGECRHGPPRYVHADVLTFPVTPARSSRSAGCVPSDGSASDDVVGVGSSSSGDATAHPVAGCGDDSEIDVGFGVDVLFWHMLPDVIPRHADLDARLRRTMDGGVVIVTVRWQVPLRHWAPYLVHASAPINQQCYYLYAAPVADSAASSP